MCKFLCGDQKDENSVEVKVKLHIDSSAAMGTIQRAGFGRMKHLQIRHISSRSLADESFQFAQDQHKDDSGRSGNEKARIRT